MKNKITPIAVIACLLWTGWTYADPPDKDQNSESNNIAYDLPSKFYVGISVGNSAFTKNTLSTSGGDISLKTQGLMVGFLGGYKVNDNFSMEVDADRLGKLSDKNALADVPLTDQATFYQVSMDGILSYPLQASYGYTVSAYGKVGYGVNITHGCDDANHNMLLPSGNSVHGAYNIGAGVNVDWRVNLSARLGYTYYQTYYDVPGVGSNHGAHVVSLSIYYNFM